VKKPETEISREAEEAADLSDAKRTQVLTTRARQTIRRLRTELASATKLTDLTTDRIRNLKRKIDANCAVLAQLELFQFCFSGRYEINPLSVANAVAGPPEIGWRHSSNRCRNFLPPPGTPNQDLYKTLRRIIHCRQPGTNLADHACQQLRKTPPSKSKGVTFLRAKWHYLRLAIEDVNTVENPVGKDLAGMILEKFLSRLAAASSDDKLREKEERITRKRPKIEA
jgi:hypothetical protein